MTAIVRGGTIVTAAGRTGADIVVRDGTIAALLPPGDRVAGESETIDASGMIVFPGIIDPHVHTRDPGQTYKEDLSHATRAAAVGGITTILEMPNAIPPVVDRDSFLRRATEHARISHVDFGLWGLAVGPGSETQFRELRSAGAPAAKLFWGFAFDRATGALVYNPQDADGKDLSPPATNGDVWGMLRESAQVGLLIGLHCEDQSILGAAARSWGLATDYESLLRVRPIEAESVAIASAVELANATGARIHILHVSSARGIELVRQARQAGTDVTAETCPHYLTLKSTDFEEVGPAMRVFRPIRTAANQAALWDAVVDGTIDSIGSDHAPHSLDERRLPFASQPAGAIGVETMLRVLLDASARGLVSLERLAWVLSEGTARRYGLFPTKGALQVGSDADMTIIDPRAMWTIRNTELHSKNPLSPWDGRTGTGLPVRTILRGCTVALDGQPVGSPQGRLVKATR